MLIRSSTCVLTKAWSVWLKASFYWTSLTQQSLFSSGVHLGPGFLDPNRICSWEVKQDAAVIRQRLLHVLFSRALLDRVDSVSCFSSLFQLHTHHHHHPHHSLVSQLWSSPAEQKPAVHQGQYQPRALVKLRPHLSLRRQQGELHTAHDFTS